MRGKYFLMLFQLTLPEKQLNARCWVRGLKLVELATYSIETQNLRKAIDMTSAALTLADARYTCRLNQMNETPPARPRKDMLKTFKGRQIVRLELGYKRREEAGEDLCVCGVCGFCPVVAIDKIIHGNGKRRELADGAIDECDMEEHRRKRVC